MEDYEREIKEKIKNNADKLTNFEYLSEYAAVDCDHLCTLDSCLVNYFTNHNEFLEDFEFTSIGLSDKVIGEKNVPDVFENKYKNLIYRLKILSNQIFIDQQTISIVKNDIPISFFEYSKTYLNFFRCISLNERQCIRKFDMSTFYALFTYDYIDENIKNFIRQLVDDQLNYSDNNKQDIIVVLIYVLGFSRRNKLKYTQLILEKLKSCIVFTRNSNIYNIDLTHDSYIDKYILKLRKIKLDSPSLIYYESLFLNHFYSNFISKPKLEREVYQDFQSRLYKIINSINEKYLMAFLKNVFFKHSVLFSCIDNVQLVKAIIDFYGKLFSRNKTEWCYKSAYDFFILLALNVPNMNLFDIIIQQTNVIFEGDKYFLLKLLSIEKLSDIKNLVETSKESFNHMKQIIDVYYSLLAALQSKSFKEELNKMNTLTEFLDVQIFIFQNLRSNFLVKSFSKHIKGFTCILEHVFVHMIESDSDDRFLLFNHSYWNVLSNIVLKIYQFMIVAHDESKKDKKKEKRQPFVKSVDTLLAIIYKTEEHLNMKYGANNVISFKSRSFKISDIPKEAENEGH